MRWVGGVAAVICATFFVSAASAEQPVMVAAAEPSSIAVEPQPQAPANEASDKALPPAAAVAAGTPPEAASAPPLDPPKPTLFADIDLATQTMTVSDQSGVRYRWPISSARAGYETPVGKFAVSWTSRMHYSRQYDWAPMPYAVFFKEGVAVHATNAVGNLGRPASHGCVRLALNNARTFYDLVGKHGMALRPRSPCTASRPIRPWWRSGAIGSRRWGRSAVSLPISSRPTSRVRARAGARSPAATGRDRARTGSRLGVA